MGLHTFDCNRASAQPGGENRGSSPTIDRITRDYGGPVRVRVGDVVLRRWHVLRSEPPARLADGDAGTTTDPYAGAATSVGVVARVYRHI